MVKRNTVILIPALNPPSTLPSYVQSLKENGFDEIIVVDDGSNEKYKEIFHDLQTKGCVLLHHAANLGKGRALKTGYAYFLNHLGDRQKIKGLITVDSDGQHAVEDVIRLDDCFLAEARKPELILGVRNFQFEQIPFKSRFGNELTTCLFYLLYGKKLKDTQTGLRGIPTELVRDYLELEGERFEYETNQLIQTVRKKIPLKEIDIRTIYIDNNSETHFDPIGDSWAIYRLLFGSFFKYSLSALSAAVIDLGMFQFLLMILGGRTGNNIYIATIGARILSSLYNYLVNKNLVFGNHMSHKITVTRYYILCVLQMFCSAFGVSLVAAILPIKEVFIKLMVDTFLFCISYRIQKKYVFVSEKK